MPPRRRPRIRRRVTTRQVEGRGLESGENRNFVQDLRDQETRIFMHCQRLARQGHQQKGEPGQRVTREPGVQLQFLDKVIDDPVARVVQVFPGRSQPVVCNDGCPGYVPQLQFTNKVVHIPVEVPRLSHIQTLRLAMEIPSCSSTRCPLWCLSCRTFLS